MREGLFTYKPLSENPAPESVETRIDQYRLFELLVQRERELTSAVHPAMKTIAAGCSYFENNNLPYAIVRGTSLNLCSLWITHWFRRYVQIANYHPDPNYQRELPEASLKQIINFLDLSFRYPVKVNDCDICVGDELLDGDPHTRLKEWSSHMNANGYTTIQKQAFVADNPLQPANAGNGKPEFTSKFLYGYDVCLHHPNYVLEQPLHTMEFEMFSSLHAADAKEVKMSPYFGVSRTPQDSAVALGDNFIFSLIFPLETLTGKEGMVSLPCLLGLGTAESYLAQSGSDAKKIGRAQLALAAVELLNMDRGIFMSDIVAAEWNSSQKINPGIDSQFTVE